MRDVGSGPYLFSQPALDVGTALISNILVKLVEWLLGIILGLKLGMEFVK